MKNIPTQKGIEQPKTQKKEETSFENVLQAMENNIQSKESHNFSFEKEFEQNNWNESPKKNTGKLDVNQNERKEDSEKKISHENKEDNVNINKESSLYINSKKKYSKKKEKQKNSSKTTNSRKNFKKMARKKQNLIRQKTIKNSNIPKKSNYSNKNNVFELKTISQVYKKDEIDKRKVFNSKNNENNWNNTNNNFLISDKLDFNTNCMDDLNFIGQIKNNEEEQINIKEINEISSNSNQRYCAYNRVEFLQTNLYEMSRILGIIPSSQNFDSIITKSSN